MVRTVLARAIRESWLTLRWLGGDVIHNPVELLGEYLRVEGLDQYNGHYDQVRGRLTELLDRYQAQPRRFSPMFLTHHKDWRSLHRRLDQLRASRCRGSAAPAFLQSQGHQAWGQGGGLSRPTNQRLPVRRVSGPGPITGKGGPSRKAPSAGPVVRPPATRRSGARHPA